jgi:chemotaxis protein MotB
MNRLCFSLLTLIFLFSCVSQKKYDQLSHDKLLMEVENAELDATLLLRKQFSDSLLQQLEACKSVVVELKGDTTALSKLYANLSKDYVKLTKSSDSDSEKLEQQMLTVSELSKQLAVKSELIEHEDYLIDSLAQNLKLREAKVDELESVLNDQERGIQEIKGKLKSALLAFEKNQDLTVEVENGKVYVSMAEQLLFKSGRYDVDASGEKALITLGSALKGLDVLINVEGHTDNVPIKSASIVESNWELSVLRATSIVKILQREGVLPELIVASGRGEFQPKAQGDSKEARKNNRRTEIIISPKLDDLYRMLEELED